MQGLRRGWELLPARCGRGTGRHSKKMAFLQILRAASNVECKKERGNYEGKDITSLAEISSSIFGSSTVEIKSTV